MEGNKISVLVTFYNQERYVDDALGSIFMQETSFPFQVIVGDDGSNDGTVEKVKQWQSKYPGRLRLVIQERDHTKKYNGVVRASRNRLSLLQLVDTPYFAFLDGDDYYTDKHKLQKQYDVLEKPENSDCVGCGHNIRMYMENDPIKSVIMPGKLIRQGKYSPKKYWRNYYYHTNTILFRSKYIKELPIDLDIVRDHFDDNIITFCFIKYGPLYFLRDCMVDYRKKEDGLWEIERDDICCIKEFLLYDYICKLNPEMKVIGLKRQLASFIKFSENHELFENVGEEYLDIAKKYKCPIARRALEDKHLFTSDWAKDTKTINAIRTQCRIESLPALPFNFANRIFSLPHLPQRVINKISDRIFHS